MNKKIITIAEIVFALVFVVLLSVFMATINSKGTTANNQLIDTLEMTSGTSIDKYVSLNGSTVKGTEVINLVTNYKTINSNTKVQIDVQTNALRQKSGSDAYSHYGYATQAKYGSIEKGAEIGTYQTPNSTDIDYINPTGDFTVNVKTSDNGIYDNIQFIQVENT